MNGDVKTVVHQNW